MTLAATDATFSLTPATRVRTTPLVFASPHSGGLYPEDMGAVVGLSEASLRSAEDAAVDRLLDGAAMTGAALPVSTRAGFRSLAISNFEVSEEMSPKAMRMRGASQPSGGAADATAASVSEPLSTSACVTT